MSDLELAYQDRLRGERRKRGPVDPWAKRLREIVTEFEAHPSLHQAALMCLQVKLMADAIDERPQAYAELAAMREERDEIAGDLARLHDLAGYSVSEDRRQERIAILRRQLVERDTAILELEAAIGSLP